MFLHSVLMVFLDGIGIGKEDRKFNPFFKYGFKAFEEIFNEIPTDKKNKLNNSSRFLFPADANLGVKGLPQSGTGQASLYCGINIPEFVGKHFGPFPYSTTIPILEEEHILVYFRNNFNSSFFANAYPESFFDYIRSGRSRLSVTPLTCRNTGISFNQLNDVLDAKALTAELTNERWNEKLGCNLPVISPAEAARRLFKIAADHSFTLYEYYLSDHLGHLRLSGEFEKLFRELDEFLFTLLNEVDENNLTLIVCSDHGNLEDISVKTHTRNPALTITAGKYSEEISKEINNLTDIKPAIIKHCT